ncbi:unnamed protein product [Sphagnum troendelagicum]|uniref:H15 domain-containing protein n=1 Tax=Sphagnum troendelagicum TaxID=128251 RepID=A0ABP0UVL6_9BRYO
MAAVTDDVAVASATVAVVEEVVAKATVPKEKKQKQEKVVKEKKPKIAKAANPSAAASHPSYLLMVKEAIGTLKERTGSSQYAIAKYLEDTYKTGLPPNFKKILSVQLRNLTKQGKLYKVKNSFKLSDDLKKPIKAPKSVVANKDAPKAIKAAAPKPTKVAKKKGPAAGRVKKSKAASNGATPKAAKPVKAPKSPAKASKLETKAAKPSKAAPPAAASKKSSEEKVVPVTKPVAPPARKAPTVRKTATPKKVATPKKKGPKSVKTAKPKVTTRAATPSKMVKEAIGSLKERTGSSQHAIAKYLEEVYKTGLPPNFKKILSVRLRNMTKQGKVYKVKNSFKLSEELKKPMMIRRKAGPIKSTLSIKGDSNKEMDVLKPIKASKPKSQNRVKKTTTTTIIDGVPVPKSPKPAKAPKAPKFENKTSKLPKPGAKPRKLSVTATKKGGEKKFTPPAVAAAAVARATKPALVSSLTSKKVSRVRKTAAKKLLTPKKSTKSVKTSKSKGVMKALPGAPSNKAVAKKAKK